MRKALKMMLCCALLIAALFSFSAFTSAPSAHAAATAHAAPATTVSPSYSCPLPVVQMYDSGWAVTLAQQSVMWWYDHPSTGFKTWLQQTAGGEYAGDFPIAVDGQFGLHTREAIEDFQDWYNHELTIDGIVGPKTWHALGHC